MLEYIKLGIGLYIGYTLASVIDKNLGAPTEKSIDILKTQIKKINK